VDISVSTGALTSVNFDFMGKDAVRKTTTTNLPGTPVASYAYDVHSGVSNTAACQVWIGNAPLAGTFAQSISFSFDNSLRTQEGICTLGAVGLGNGEIMCEVQAEIYFSSGALFDAFVANVDQQVIFSSVDAAGNGYVFTLPKANISSYSAPAGQKDSDLMASVTFKALRNDLAPVDALKKAIFVDRVGTAVV
jgi:hypothetical protein